MNKQKIKILAVETPEYENEIKLTYKKYNENESYIMSLKHIRHDLDKMISEIQDKNNIKLQSKINKAIEYIENKMEINKECPIELLNILKGEENE